MKTSVWKAWNFGGIIVLVSYGAWFIVLLTHTSSAVLRLLCLAVPLIAAFVVGYFAPRRQTLLGGSIAIFTAGLACVFNFVYHALGNPVDLPSLTIFVYLLIIYTIPCMLAAGLGDFLDAWLTRGTRS